VAEQPVNEGELVTREEARQQDLFPAELVALERQRIDSQDKRTAVARAAIDAQQESDKRQFEFHMARLKSDEASGEKRFRFASKYLWTILVTGIGVLALLLAMIFFGGEHQSQLAIKAFKVLGNAAVGAGALILGRHFWRTFLATNGEES
jgi:hypothetical protein